MIQEIYVIDNNDDFTQKLQEMFKDEKDYRFIWAKDDELEDVLNNIPSLIIVKDNGDAEKICKLIRENEDNNITPVIVVSSNSDHDYRTRILNQYIQYFILEPIDNEYFHYTIRNITDFAMINRRISPLTGLPGNVQIQTEIKKRLLRGKSFAVMYFDLDNFKPYNDVYGFSNGDEVIKLLSRIIVENIHDLNCSNSFIGHIGGDDFVAIIDKYNYDNLCKNIIDEFDDQIEDYYTEDDLERGYIEVANRRGIIEQFPIVTISIAVIEVENGNFKNSLEIGEVSAQVKHVAKETPGSSYVVNRRRKIK